MTKKGFTLMELMLVVVIIGVIAVLGIPRYYKTVAITRERTIVDALHIIHAASELYLARNGNYHVPPEGVIADLAYINSALQIDILMDPEINFAYSTVEDAGGEVVGYEVFVTYGSVTVMLSEEPLYPGPGSENPHCGFPGGACYIIPARST